MESVYQSKMDGFHVKLKKQGKLFLADIVLKSKLNLL